MSTFDKVSADQTSIKSIKSSKIPTAKTNQKPHSANKSVVPRPRKLETAVCLESDQKTSPQIHSAAPQVAKNSQTASKIHSSENLQNSNSYRRAFDDNSINREALYGDLSFDLNSNHDEDDDEELTEDISESFHVETDTDVSFTNIAKLFREQSKQKMYKSAVHSQQMFPRPVMSKVISSVTQPLSDFYCNVTHHHKLEDELTALQSKLYDIQCNENPLELLELRKQLKEKDSKISQLESTVLTLSGGSRLNEGTSIDAASEKVSLDLFKARVLSLTAALGRCTTSEKVIENYLEGKCGLDRVQELVSRAESVNQLSAESSHLEQEIEKNQSQLDHLEGLIAKCEDQAVQLDNQIKTKLSSLEDKEAKWHLYQKQGREFSFEIEKAASDLEETSSTVDVLKKESKLLAAEKAQIKSELSELETNLQIKQSEYDSLQKLCGDACTLLKKARSDETELHEGLEECEGLLERKENELQDLEDEIDLLTSEHNIAKSTFLKQAKNLELVTQELESVKTELKSAKNSLEAVNKERAEKCDTLESDVKSLEKRKVECEQFLKSVDEKYQKLCSQAEQQAEKIKKLANESEGAITRRNYLVELMQLEETQLDGLKTQHGERIQQLQSLQADLNEERNELERLQKERLRADQQLALAKNNAQAFKKESAEIETERERVELSMAELDKRKRVLESEISQLESTVHSMKQNIAHAESELEKINEQTELQLSTKREIEAHINDLGKERIQLQHNIKTLQSEYSKYCEAAKSLAGEIDNRSNKIKQLNEVISELSQQILREEKLLKDKQGESEELRRRQDSFEELKRKLDAEKAIRQDLENKLKEVENRLAKVLEETESTKKSEEKLFNRNSQLKHTVSSLRSELSAALSSKRNLEEDVETATNEKLGLKMQIAELEHKMENKEFTLPSTFSNDQIQSHLDLELIDMSCSSRKSIFDGDDCSTPKPTTPGLSKKSTSATEAKQLLQKQLDEAETKFSRRKPSLSLSASSRSRDQQEQNNAICLEVQH